MKKQKLIKNIEYILDCLEADKKTASHNEKETNAIVDRMIDFQILYHQYAGHYYHRKVYKDLLT